MATYNWIITCDCCNPAEHYCNTCRENLCSNCKKLHLENKNTKQHAVVLYLNKSLPGKAPVPHCHDHAGKDYIYWCKTCNTAACMDCVTSSHDGHRFTKLEDNLQDRRAILQEQLKNLESNSLRAWQDLLVHAKGITSEYMDQINTIENGLEERAEEFHKIVNEIKEGTKEKLNELKAQGLIILQEQENRVSDGLEKVKEQIKECEDRLRSGDMESLLGDAAAFEAEKEVLPKMSRVIPPVFDVGQINTMSLTEMFGQLDIPKMDGKVKGCEDRIRSKDMESLLDHAGVSAKKKDVLPQMSSMIPSVVGPSQEDTASLTGMFVQLAVPKGNEGYAQMSCTKEKARTEIIAETTQVPTPGFCKSNTPRSHRDHASPLEPEHFMLKPSLQSEFDPGYMEFSKPIKSTPRHTPRPLRDNSAPLETEHLMFKLLVQSEFNPGYTILSVACVEKGRAWLADETKLQLVDGRGSLQDTIHTDIRFNDLVTSPHGELLLTDAFNKCIKSISKGKEITTLFKTQIGKLRPQLLTPYGLCYLLSGDIAVTFRVEGRVVIFSMFGKVVKELDKKLFSHPFGVAQNKINKDLYVIDKAELSSSFGTGKVLVLDKACRVRYEYSGLDDRDSFSPASLCTDDAGHVLVTDYHKNRVHILDKDGKFLQYLLTGEQGLDRPCRIDADSDGNIWVADHGGAVKVVRYI